MVSNILVLFTLFVEMIPYLTKNIFSNGWLNHQLGICGKLHFPLLLGGISKVLLGESPDGGTFPIFLGDGHNSASNLEVELRLKKSPHDFLGGSFLMFPPVDVGISDHPVLLLAWFCFWQIGDFDADTLDILI